MFSRQKILLLLALLAVFDLVVWLEIIRGAPQAEAEAYFFDVGQGDSELLVFPGGVEVLIDGGPGSRASEELAAALGSFDRYVDLVILTHPQTDHFLGLIDILKEYRVGAFLSAGDKGEAASYSALEAAIAQKNIPVLAVGAGGRISFRESSLRVLWPARKGGADNVNERSLVLLFESRGAGMLFTGDINSETEMKLARAFDLDVDVLKVSHHGSRFSSGEEFLREVSPAVSVIGVGKNSYGHPSAQVLQRLQALGSGIFRTDEDGTVRLTVAGSKLSVFKAKTKLRP